MKSSCAASSWCRSGSLLRVLLVNCDLGHRSRKRAVHLLRKPNRSMHMLGYGLHLFRKDAIPHSVLVVAIIFVVVLLFL
jgi:hypothetical protein